MKQKLSITIDEETIKVLEEALKTGVFRNRSHAIEFGLKRMLEEHARAQEEGK